MKKLVIKTWDSIVAPSARKISRGARFLTLVLLALLSLAMGGTSHATISDAATAGVTAITGLVADVNALGAAFILVVLAGVVWFIVSGFCKKSKSH